MFQPNGLNQTIRRMLIKYMQFLLHAAGTGHTPCPFLLLVCVQTTMLSECLCDCIYKCLYDIVVLYPPIWPRFVLNSQHWLNDIMTYTLFRTRRSSSNPHCRTTRYAQRGISASGSVLWNSLPQAVRDLYYLPQSFKQFCSRRKTFLFCKAY